MPEGGAMLRYQPVIKKRRPSKGAVVMRDISMVNWLLHAVLLGGDILPGAGHAR